MRHSTRSHFLFFTLNGRLKFFQRGPGGGGEKIKGMIRLKGGGILLSTNFGDMPFLFNLSDIIGAARGSRKNTPASSPSSRDRSEGVVQGGGSTLSSPPATPTSSLYLSLSIPRWLQRRADFLDILKMLEGYKGKDDLPALRKTLSSAPYNIDADSMLEVTMLLGEIQKRSRDDSSKQRVSNMIATQKRSP
jgi:hypothetical protein